jgi:hypothetical protein
MLLLLSGEVHEVHQSERLHHDGRLRKELLLVGQRSVQSFASKHRKVTNNDILLFLLETLLCFQNMTDLFTNDCHLILWFGFYTCYLPLEIIYFNNQRRRFLVVQTFRKAPSIEKEISSLCF